MKRGKPFIYSTLLYFFISIQLQAFQENPYTGTLLQNQLDALDSKGKVDFINTHFYKIYSADFETGRAKAAEALAISKSISYKLGEAKSAMQLGVIQYLSGDYENALPNYILAESIFDSLENKLGLVMVRNEMSVFYGKQGKPEKSLELLKYTEQTARELGELEHLGTSLGFQATLIQRAGNEEKAYQLYQEVYEIRKQTNDSIGIGYALLDMAEIRMNAKDFKQAMEYVDQSIAVRKSIGDNQGLAISILAKAQNYYEMKNLTKAREVMEQSLALAEDIGFMDLAKYVYDRLIEISVEQGNYQSAYVYKTRSSALKDSLFNTDRTRVIEEMNAKYETSQKEKVIALQQAELGEQKATNQRNILISIVLALSLALAVLFIIYIQHRNRKNTEILLKEREVLYKEAQISAAHESQEQERRRFAQDLHDGFGQLISSLKIYIGQIQKTNDLAIKAAAYDKSEKLIEEMHREIRNIAFNLMPTTLIQYGLPLAVKEFAQRLTQTGGVAVTVDSFDMDQRLTELQEISLYRVIQECVNNILKYAKASKINIQLIRHDEEILLMIEDNGNGFDTSVLEHNKGNGWRNIKSRLGRIGATINIDSRAGYQGTTIEIELPIKSGVEQEKPEKEIELV